MKFAAPAGVALIWLACAQSAYAALAPLLAYKFPASLGANSTFVTGQTIVDQSGAGNNGIRELDRCQRPEHLHAAFGEDR